MGFLSKIASVAAPVIGSYFGGPIGGAIGSAIGGAIGGSGGSSQSGSMTTTQQQQMDPRMQAYLYGDGKDNKGLLGQISASANQPRSTGLAAFGGAADQFLGANGSGLLSGQLATANRLQNSAIAAPQATAAQTDGSRVWTSPTMQAAFSGGAQIAAPSQNSLDLRGAYDRLINGDAGANPYLTKALQSAVDQTNASYSQNLGDLTNTLTRSVLPQISSNAVLAGQYGGSRQGIAEGLALSDFSKQMANTNLQLGLANSANTTGQQAGAFNAGQDRALNAVNTLSGQQFGTATANAQLAQQAAQANADRQQAANSQNASMQQQTNLADAGMRQQTTLANLSNQQQTNMANLSAQADTNRLNSGNQIAGLGASSGLLGSAAQYANANDQYQINRNGQVAAQLAPFTGLNSSSSMSTPLYSNPFANAVGGAASALGLYSNLRNSGLLGGSDGNFGNFLSSNAGLNMAPSDLYSIFGS